MKAYKTSFAVIKEKLVKKSLSLWLADHGFLQTVWPLERMKTN